MTLFKGMRQQISILLPGLYCETCMGSPIRKWRNDSSNLSACMSRVPQFPVRLRSFIIKDLCHRASMKEAVMFTIDVFRSSHQFSIPFRTSRTQLFRRPLFRRAHISSPPHKKKPFSLPSRRQRVSSTDKPILRHTDRHAIPVKSIYLRLMPAVGSNTGETFRQPPDGAEELAGKPQSAQLLSGIIKSVAVAIALVITANPPFNYFINLIRETRLGLKLVRAARKQSCTIKVAHVVSSCLAFVVFIVYDIRNLSHDKPIDVEVKKTVQEDPAAALANARKELAIMMKGKDVTSDKEKRR